MINESAVSKVLNKILKHDSNKQLLDDIRNLNMSANPYVDPDVEQTCKTLYEIYNGIQEFCGSVRKKQGNVVFTIPTIFDNIVDTTNAEDSDDEDTELSDDTDSYSEKDISLALRVFKGLANAVISSGEYLSPNIDASRFETLFKDMVMSASMRSWRLYTFMSDPKFERVKPTSVLTRGKKLVNLRLQKKDDLEYRDTDIYNDYTNEFHKDFPISVTSKEAIDTFMQSKTPFAIQARMQYLGTTFTESVEPEEGISREEYNKRKDARASDIEASKLKRAELQNQYKKRNKEHKTKSSDINALDYILHSTAYFMSSLISKGDIKTESDVERIFNNANNGMDRGTFDSSAEAYFSLDNFDEAPTEPVEQEHTLILDDQEIHNEYVIVVCKKVIEQLSDDYMKDFDFYIIDPPGSGNIVKKNLYRNFIKSEFDDNIYSKNGALLIQQLYRNWLVGDETDEATGKLNTRLLKVKQDISDIIKKLPTNPITSSYLEDLSNASGDFAASTVYKNINRILQPNTSGGRFANKVSEHLRKFFIKHNEESKLASDQLINNFEGLFGINLKVAIKERGGSNKGKQISSGNINIDDVLNLFKSNAIRSFRQADPTKLLYKSQSPGLDPDKRLLYLVRDTSDIEAAQNELFNTSTSSKPILPLFKSKEDYENCITTYDRIFDETRNTIKESKSLDEIITILYTIASESFGQNNISFFRNCKELNKPKTSPTFGTSFFPDKYSVKPTIDKIMLAGGLTKASPSIALNTAVSIVASKGLLKPEVNRVDAPVTEAVTDTGYSYAYEKISNTVKLYCGAYLLRAVLSFSKMVKDIEKTFSKVLSKLDNHTKSLLYEDSESLSAGPSYDAETDELVEKICKAIKNAIEDEESDLGSEFSGYTKDRLVVAKRRTRAEYIKKMKEGKPLSKLPELSEEDLFN